MKLPLSAIRQHFPILHEKVHGKELIYLDSAATAQKPKEVLEAMTDYYEHENGNPHRGMHPLAERATLAYERARVKVRSFIGADRKEEIIFTKNGTEAINLVARTLGRTLVEGDAIVLSVMEHHSNIIPWLQLKEERGIELQWLDIDQKGQIDLKQLDEYLREGNVKMVAITGQSNVLGSRPPLSEIIDRAHAASALVLIDAAQLVAHHQISVKDLPCDFLTFSSHKLYGPTGIGVLYGKAKLLSSLPPFLGGGMMIKEVFEDRFSTADIPMKFESGTQPIAEAVGLAAAIDWISQYSWKDIEAHEQALLAKATQELTEVKGVKILGSREGIRSGCISFTIDGIHPHDLTEILGAEGICLRAGHHCTQPLHRRLGIPASTRLSVGIYNTEEDIAAFIAAVKKAVKILS